MNRDESSSHFYLDEQRKETGTKRRDDRYLKYVITNKKH